MAQKWNLQDIKPAGAPKPSTREPLEKRPKLDIAPKVKHEEEHFTAFDDADLESLEIVDGNAVKRRRVLYTILTSLIIIGIGVGVNILLGGAKITVYPKVRDVSVQSNFTAFTEPTADNLSYELLSFSLTDEKQVKANGKEKVTTKAEGKIFVYNSGTKPQQLIKDTRFESPDGHIFRIRDAITVPKANRDANGTVSPGSVVADVIADAVGEAYNIAPTKFTVPGLKGSEQFDVISGESTVAFSGGFDGEKFMLDEAELNTAKQALHVDLRDKLIAKLSEQVPGGFILFKDAVTFVYESLPSTEYGDSFATIKEKVTLNVPIFKDLEFAKYLAAKSIPDYSGDDVKVVDPTTLSFSYAGATTTQSDISGSKEIEFILKGSAKIVWLFDETRLKSQLVSTKKNSATSVFSTYNSISHAQAEVRPFWATSFPSDAKDITVETVLDQK